MKKIHLYSLLACGLLVLGCAPDGAEHNTMIDEDDPALLEHAKEALTEATILPEMECPSVGCAADVWGPDRPVFEGDQVIDIYDLYLTWAGANIFAEQEVYFAKLDFNCDHAVNESDMWFVHNRYGTCMPCFDNKDCTEAEYCLAESCMGPGFCEIRPTMCPDIYLPVCGCDGVTYGNSCDAGALGASIAHEGECESCVTNEDCPETEYCAKQNCGNESGQCAPRGIYCPNHADPVCGCDGMTYGNTCDATALGMSVAYTGECN